MNGKPFFIYSLIVSIMFIAMAIFLIFFDTRMVENFGKTKVTYLGIFILAYGLFRLYRAFKFFKDSE